LLTDVCKRINQIKYFLIENALGPLLFRRTVALLGSSCSWRSGWGYKVNPWRWLCYLRSLWSHLHQIYALLYHHLLESGFVHYNSCILCFIGEWSIIRRLIFPLLKNILEVFFLLTICVPSSKSIFQVFLNQFPVECIRILRLNDQPFIFI